MRPVSSEIGASLLEASLSIAVGCVTLMATADLFLIHKRQVDMCMLSQRIVNSIDPLLNQRSDQNSLQTWQRIKDLGAAEIAALEYASAASPSAWNSPHRVLMAMEHPRETLSGVPASEWPAFAYLHPGESAIAHTAACLKGTGPCSQLVSQMQMNHPMNAAADEKDAPPGISVAMFYNGLLPFFDRAISCDKYQWSPSAHGVKVGPTPTPTPGPAPSPTPTPPSTPTPTPSPTPTATPTPTPVSGAPGGNVPTNPGGGAPTGGECNCDNPIEGEPLPSGPYKGMKHTIVYCEDPNGVPGAVRHECNPPEVWSATACRCVIGALPDPTPTPFPTDPPFPIPPLPPTDVPGPTALDPDCNCILESEADNAQVVECDDGTQIHCYRPEEWIQSVCACVNTGLKPGSNSTGSATDPTGTDPQVLNPVSNTGLGGLH